LIAGGIVLLAAVLALWITALRDHADRARMAQIVAAELNSDAQHISRVEWQATAQRRAGRELDRELELIDRRIDGLLVEYSRSGAADAAGLRAQAHGYVEAVGTQLALLDGGRVVTAARVDRLEVDPTFRQLQRRLRQIDTVQSTKAKQAAGWADLGVTASLLLAALVLIVLLARFNSLREAAARKRTRDLEVQALHDALTGLPNRRKLLIDLEQALLHADADAGERCVLVLCDLDGFKAYNDTFGHPKAICCLAGSAGSSPARSLRTEGRTGSEATSSALCCASTEPSWTRPSPRAATR
jgi:hypothetical protein